MFKYFPIPYPDEMLGSAIVRFQVHVGSNSCELISSLFGSKVVLHTVGLQGRLKFLLNNTPLSDYYDGPTLALKHTLLPYYTAFAGYSTRNRLLNRMLNRYSFKPFVSSTRFAARIPEAYYPRYCPLCMEEDIKLYGEPYWHRSHQLAGVYFCPIHEIELYDRCPVCDKNFESFNNISYPYLSSHCVDGHAVTVQSNFKINKELKAKLIFFSQESNQLLNGDICYQPSKIIKLYNLRLQEMGLGGRKRMKIKLIALKEFIEFYTPELLDITNSELDITDKNNWIRKVLNFVNLHPLRHILMIGFLFGSVSNIKLGASFAKMHPKKINEIIK